MLRVYACVTEQHDAWMIVLAIAVCLLSSATAMGMLGRIGGTSGVLRMAWLAATAAVTGAGVWATHFIAILGFSDGFSISYDPIGTAASLLAAILVLGVAIHVALRPGRRHAATLGGAVAGLAIGTMHYLGMAALWVEGRKLWDADLVAVSLALGVVLGAMSFAVALGGRSFLRQVGGAALLTLAICSLHFTGMTAVSLLPDPMAAPQPDDAVTDQSLARWVAAAAVALLAIAVAALLIGYRQRRSEERRLRELADAAVEGLAICDDGRIVTGNTNLARMVGLVPEQLVGRRFASLFEDGDSFAEGLGAGLHREAGIRAADGTIVPVELLVHALSSDGKPRLGIAVRDLRDRIAAEARMRFLAHHDPLTGLPNRLSFGERLQEEEQRQRRLSGGFALLYLDLDRFKRVNDLLGHAAGDQLLRIAGQRVSGELDERDFFARQGGDEFAIIRPGSPSRREIDDLCRRIHDAVVPDIHLDGQIAVVGVSIGIAMFPEDGSDIATLERNADTALYQAKARRGGHHFFEASLGVRLRDRHAMELDLRLALARGQLRLVYQPQVALDTETVFGFEALLRWMHPTRGEVAPDVFIPLAEETGLIAPIGEWVLGAACAEAASWPKPLQIAVNVSGVQLRSPTLPDRVAEILEQTGLAPERLEIEITETALIEDLDQALRTLRRLKAIGIKVAMDDFGTGYSSLSNLRAFPFDKVKVDKSFVRNVDRSEDGATIVRAILGLCHDLKLAVLAEGVETTGELQFLGQQDCRQAQGYLFGRPGDISQFPMAFTGDAQARPPPAAA